MLGAGEVESETNVTALLQKLPSLRESDDVVLVKYFEHRSDQLQSWFQLEMKLLENKIELCHENVNRLNSKLCSYKKILSKKNINTVSMAMELFFLLGGFDEISRKNIVFKFKKILQRTSSDEGSYVSIGDLLMLGLYQLYRMEYIIHQGGDTTRFMKSVPGALSRLISRKVSKKLNLTDPHQYIASLGAHLKS